MMLSDSVSVDYAIVQVCESMSLLFFSRFDLGGRALASPPDGVV